MTNLFSKIYKNGVEYQVYGGGSPQISDATSTTAGIVKLGSDTQQTTAANAVSSTADRTYAIQKNSSGQQVVNVPWTDHNTTYTAGTNITIDSNNVISANGGVTYTAGTNVQISNENVISATDTTYTATDFDIKDLTDSTGLRTTWSGKQGEHIALTVTLAVNDWSNNEQTVTATGVTANNTVFISPATSSISDYCNAQIYCTAQGTNSLTFTCTTVPENAITINVVVFN